MTTPTLDRTTAMAPHGAAPSHASPGIAFRESMAGPFALENRDPDEGARAGASTGTTLRLRVSIQIPDLAAFLADREHAGLIAGTVDFPPLGRALVAERGTFQLFAPTAAEGGAPGHRVMAYGVELSCGGEPYYLDGRKLVMGVTPWRLWTETSTLFATLHRGHSPADPIVGAGVLRLGAFAFLRLLPTLRAPGAPTLPAQAATLLRFGRFFGDELWAAYVRGVPVA